MRPPPMRFDRHLILGEKRDAFGPQQVALKLLQPERAPTDGQAPAAIDDAVPGDIRGTDGERPPHHARRHTPSTQRRDIPIRGDAPARNTPHQPVDLGEASAPIPAREPSAALSPPASLEAPSLMRSHGATPPRGRG